MPAYEMRHIIAFEDTNLVGNVYYANPIRWQGRCRELFLREHAPEVLEELSRDLAFVTLRVGCEYFQELEAFDEVAIRMHLADLSPHRMTLGFDYHRISEQGEELVARGEQELACMRRSGGKLEPERWPVALREALRPFAED